MSERLPVLPAGLDASTSTAPAAARVRELAEAIADVLEERFTAGRPPLVGVAELARFLNVEPGWVYAHAGELGAWRLGAGPRAPLRFDLGEVERRLVCCSSGRTSVEPSTPTVEPTAGRRRRRRSGTSVPLLPVRGGDRG